MIAADVSNAGSGDSIVTLLRASLPFVSSVEPSKDARLTVHASCSSIHAKTKDDCDNHKDFRTHSGARFSATSIAAPQVAIDPKLGQFQSIGIGAAL